MASTRRNSKIGESHTRTGLAERKRRATDDTERGHFVPTRGTDELLARAREAGIDLRVDEVTLAAVESRLRDV